MRIFCRGLCYPKHLHHRGDDRPRPNCGTHSTNRNDVPPQPTEVDFSGAVLGVDLIGQKRMRSLQDVYGDPRSDKGISPNPPQGTRRRTYRENVERPCESDRSGRDETGPIQPTGLGFLLKNENLIVQYGR